MNNTLEMIHDCDQPLVVNNDLPSSSSSECLVVHLMKAHKGYQMPKPSQSSEYSTLISKVPEFDDWTVQSTTRIATLWSNYGSIERVALRPAGKSHKNSGHDTNRFIIVKTVSPPWVEDQDEGHLRKLLSYEVERWFYYNLSARLPHEAKVAVPYSLNEGEGSNAPIRLLMEDLSVDYPYPARGSLGLDDTRSVLSWLARFHGTFWGIQEEDIAKIPPPLQYTGGSKDGIWEQGTYWYLDTRREEMDNVGTDHAWLLEWVEKVRPPFGPQPPLTFVFRSTILSKLRYILMVPCYTGM